MRDFPAVFFLKLDDSDCSAMNPEFRYKLLRYTLIVFSVIHLLIGLMMALLAYDHLTTESMNHQSSSELEYTPPLNQTLDFKEETNERRSRTTFDLVMNGTDEHSQSPVFPEAALVASAALVLLSVVGLVGLCSENIILIVIFGLVSILFQVLRTYVLLRTWIREECQPEEGCVRDEAVNTIIGIVEICLIFRLAHEMRLRRMRRVVRDEDPFPDMRTSIPTVGAASGVGGGKEQTDVEEMETSLTVRRHSLQHNCAQDPDSGDRRRSSTQSFPNFKIPVVVSA